MEATFTILKITMYAYKNITWLPDLKTFVRYGCTCKLYLLKWECSW